MDLLVAADDRTGAVETAAALADHGAGPVPVRVWPAIDDPTDDPAGDRSGVVVVDLGTRHVSPTLAGERAARITGGARAAHKIDSTLRGNWAEELLGRSRADGRSVLLVPALPALGRVCVGGTVFAHDRPVHEAASASDVRRRVRSSRPADSLRAAGATAVTEAAGIDDVERWLAEPHGLAVADAADGDRIAAIVARWVDRPDVLLAGTSAVIGAATPALTVAQPAETLPALEGPVLVVCGSVHPAARAQVMRAERHGVPVATVVDDVTVATLEAVGHLVLVSEIPVGAVDEPAAVAAATTLARGVRTIADRVELGGLVVIGGDTAAAVVGDQPMTVHGSVVEGTAWGTTFAFDMPVITRAGGFGDDRALLELLWGVRRPGAA